MRARDLAEFLARHPGHLVRVEAPQAGLFLADGAQVDRLWTDEGPCIVISVELNRDQA